MKPSPLAPPHLPELHAVAGIRLATGQSGIKYKGRDDVMLMVADQPVAAAGTLTRSLTCSAAVDWCRNQLSAGRAQAILVNAGNSNAFTGKLGEESVRRCAAATADAVGCTDHEVLLASTGVIGEPMADDKITSLLPEMMANLKASSWADAADAIRTTDTFAKAASRQVTISGAKITLTGIAKGSGMIAPDMATMLAFIATDADISPPLLQDLVSEATDASFNAITVDSDTSTSDTILILASGKAEMPTMTQRDSTEAQAFLDALKDLMIDLACQVVRDGEGASKFITIRVTGAEDARAARKIGLAIANSPLVKTAIAGEDANWGRIVMAVGKSGERADRDQLAIAMGGVTIAKDGQRVEDFNEAPVAAHMKGDAILIEVDVGVGQGQAVVWTCDLTHGYISINANYRS
jgi:glutamate N-acetyltransferase/amino-acid N-acetyltransferase